MRKVLFIEWASKGRDFDIDLPLMYFFENILNYKIEYKSIFDHWGIINCKPDIIIMSNTTGAKANVSMVQKIKQSGFLLFSHCSEGFFNQNDIRSFVWGWNKNEELYEEICQYWSKSAYQLAISNYQQLDGRVKISGSIGHDKYIFSSKQDKKNKYKICYAANDFHNLLDNKKRLIKKSGEKFFEKNQRYANKIKKILFFIIKENKNIEFLIKPHPGDGNRVPMEIQGLNFKNIKLLNSTSSMIDTMKQCDIWLSFRSSTGFEASLFGIPVISFCCDRELASHSEFIEASIIESNPVKVNQYIKDFYKSGKIVGLENKSNSLPSLVDKFIGFSDGFNHVRFMSFLKPYIESDIPKRKWKISFKEKAIALIYHWYYKCWFFLPKNDYINRWRDLFDPEDIIEQKKKLYPELDRFYKDNKEQIKNIYQNYASQWKEINKIKKSSN
eukprot:COSAG01_NODE_755_length_13819_cov_130.671939_9_plen_443_part_00